MLNDTLQYCLFVYWTFVFNLETQDLDYIILVFHFLSVFCWRNFWLVCVWSGLVFCSRLYIQTIQTFNHLAHLVSDVVKGSLESHILSHHIIFVLVESQIFFSEVVKSPIWMIYLCWSNRFWWFLCVFDHTLLNIGN